VNRNCVLPDIVSPSLRLGICGGSLFDCEKPEPRRSLTDVVVKGGRGLAKSELEANSEIIALD